MIELRPYQREAVDAVYDFWRRGGGNPLCELATGLGKSVIIAELTRSLLTEWRDMRVLCLVHVRELVEQDFRALIRLWPDAHAGIYSAGLGRRDAHHRITFASIQSVYRRASVLGPRDLVLIDEAHLVPKAGEGMYRRLLDDLRNLRPDMRVAGLTATPFRLDSGRLDQGDDRLFDEIVYSYDIGAGIRDGWLSPLMSKASLTEIDVSGVQRRGGEFIAGALEAAADRHAVTEAAADEILRLAQDRRSWLIFCAGIKHAHHVREALQRRGVNAATITGETPAGERASLISRFRSGELRCLTNAQVLTTGFDAPMVDLIVFLRPTLSTGLYLQMVGRGVRQAAGKDNCLVLDFAGNVRRHGPVDAVTAPERTGGSGGEKTEVDAVMAKECPDCQALVALNTMACRWCGHEFPRNVAPKHEAQADDTPILSSERTGPELVPVVSWKADRWRKEGSPDSLCITYFAGVTTYREWWCVEHKGYARDKVERLWRAHGGGIAPATVTEALAAFPALAMPETISVRRNPENRKFFDVVGRRHAARKMEAAE